MARPERNNVDYFPLYVENGRKMFFIENKYGNDGYCTWLKILTELAKANFHYLNLNDETQLMYLSASCRIEESKLKNIINDLVKLGEFDKYLWENSIIFSEKFCESIKDAYLKRNNKIITLDSLVSYLLGLGILKPSKSTNKGVDNTQRIGEDRKEEDINTRSNIFGESLNKYITNENKEEVIKFWNYWTEPNKSKSKMKFEIEKTWDTKKRLATWFSNAEKFKK
jgi:hypothetical protein